MNHKHQPFSSLFVALLVAFRRFRLGKSRFFAIPTRLFRRIIPRVLPNPSLSDRHQIAGEGLR